MKTPSPVHFRQIVPGFIVNSDSKTVISATQRAKRSGPVSGGCCVQVAWERPQGFQATPARSGAYILQSSFTIVPAKFFSWSTFTRRHSLVLSCLESKTQVHRLHGPHSGKVLIQLPRWPWAEGDSAIPPGPRRHVHVWRHFLLSRLGRRGTLLASSGWRPRMLLHSPRGTAQPPRQRVIRSTRR